MRVFVTGATGFIGRALIPRLQRDGHAVVAWVRSPARARGLLGAEVEMVHADTALGGLVAALERCDAVVNLAGEPLMGGRWTAARRAVLERQPRQGDRTTGGRDGRGRTCPRVFVSGSAVGYYGDRGDESLTESSSDGDDFLAQLCLRWESAAADAEAAGRARRAAADGRRARPGRRRAGADAAAVPLRRRRARRIRTQYLPWIHLHDLVKIIAVALVDDRYRGPVNGVAPEQATSRSFARALGRALHRPAVLPVPALALKAIFGEAAIVLLASQRVEPRELRERRFAFDFPTLDAALEDIVGGAAVAISPARRDPKEPARLATSCGPGRWSTRRSIRRSRSSRRPRTSA